MALLPQTRAMRKLRRTTLAAVSACVPFLAASPLDGQEMALPIPVQWGLYDNILAFDRTFADRGEDGLVVGVLYQSRFRPSALAHAELLDMAQAGQLQLGKRDVRIVSIEVTTLRQAEVELLEQNVDVVYVTPLRAVSIADLTQLSIEHRLVTLTGVREFWEQGLAIGLGLRGGRPEILVHLESCRAQGLELSSELLNIATVLQESSP